MEGQVVIQDILKKEVLLLFLTKSGAPSPRPGSDGPISYLVAVVGTLLIM